MISGKNTMLIWIMVLLIEKGRKKQRYSLKNQMPDAD